MSLSADILRGHTDAIILAQLIGGDSYGYEINRNISQRAGGDYGFKEATLYTAFKRLEQNGFITSYWGEEGPGARRRYYAITQAGICQLAADRQEWAETKKVLDALINMEEG